MQVSVCVCVRASAGTHHLSMLWLSVLWNIEVRGPHQEMAGKQEVLKGALCSASLSAPIRLCEGDACWMIKVQVADYPRYNVLKCPSFLPHFMWLSSRLLCVPLGDRHEPRFLKRYFFSSAEALQLSGKQRWKTRKENMKVYIHRGAAQQRLEKKKREGGRKKGKGPVRSSKTVKVRGPHFTCEALTLASRESKFRKNNRQLMAEYPAWWLSACTSEKALRRRKIKLQRETRNFVSKWEKN